MKSFQDFQQETVDSFGARAEQVVKQVISEHPIESEPDLLFAAVLAAGLLTDYRLEQYHRWLHES